MPYKIIDTHIHVWDFNQAEYAWLKGNTSLLNRTYNINEIKDERISTGITEGMLVQAANNFEDTDWMLKVADNTDWITGVVGWLPLQHPEQIENAITKYSSNKYFKGVRHLIHDEADPQWLLQPEVMESLELLVVHNLPFDVVGILPAHIETALTVGKKIPGLRMVFDHLNQPPIATKEKFGQWGELMKEAAQHPNFYVKISGLGTTSVNFNAWKEDDLQPYIEFALQQFGDDRCFCGGDWPVSLLAGSYTKTWKAYQNILGGLLDASGLQKVYSENAIRFYNL